MQKIYNENLKVLEDFKNDLNGHYITLFCGCLNETCIRLYWVNDTDKLEYAIIALIEKKEVSVRSEHDINTWTLIKEDNTIEKECKTYDEFQQVTIKIQEQFFDILSNRKNSKCYQSCKQISFSESSTLVMFGLNNFW